MISSQGHLLAGKTKAIPDPVFISLSGAHGLLKFAVQLLSEKAGSKPQRRYNNSLSGLYTGSECAAHWL